MLPSATPHESMLFRRRLANAVLQGCLATCSGTGLLIVLSLIFYSWATALPAFIVLIASPIFFALGALVGSLGRTIIPRRIE